MSSYSFLKSSVLFKTMGHEQLRLVEPILRREFHEKGDLLVHQGDWARDIYFIQYGSLKVQPDTTEASKFEKYEVLGTGSYWGNVTELKPVKSSVVVEVLEHSEILKLSVDDLNQVFRENPALSAAFFQAVASTLNKKLMKAEGAPVKTPKK